MLDSLLSMTWRDTLFLHWPVDPDVVDQLPVGVDLDTRDGRAWLGVVAFVMEDARLRGAPSGLSVPEARFDAWYRRAPGARPFVAEPGALPHFLTERYRFYTHSTDRNGPLYYGDIDHSPRGLSEGRADVQTSTLFATNGFADPEDDPLVHYCPGPSVTAGPIRRVASGPTAAGCAG